MEVYSKLGEIVMNFVSLEFAISDIAYKLTITKDRMFFLADQRTGSKIEKLIRKFKKSDIHQKEDYIVQLNKFNKVRIKRNQFVHALILQNSSKSEEYISFHYKLKDEGIEKNVSQIGLKDFDEINFEIKQIHKSFCNIFYNG